MTTGEDTRSLHVLIVVPWDDTRGGVIAVVDNVARHLLAAGHRALFFHSGGLLLQRAKTRLGYDGIRLRLAMPFGGGLRGIVRTLLFPFVFASTLLQLVRFLRRERIDVINVHYPHDNSVYFAICRRLLPITLVTSVHGRDAFERERPLERYSRAFTEVVHASDLIILPSDSYRQKFLDGFPEMRDRTLFIHNGVNDSQFTARKRTVRLAGADRYVLCVAELQDYKAIDVLVSAMRPLLERDPSLTLVLVGNGPQRANLESLAVSLGIRDRILFLGTQGATEIVRLLHGAEVMVLPSRMEPFGIVLLEAMACQVPVIATRVGGIPEIVEHEVNGLLVEPDNPAALTSAIERLLADDALSQALAERGRARVMERFRTEHNGTNYVATLASLVRRERHGTQPPTTSSATTAHDQTSTANVR